MFYKLEKNSWVGWFGKKIGFIEMKGCSRKIKFEKFTFELMFNKKQF